MTIRIHIPEDQLRFFCLKNGIRKLAIFGSALTDHFGPGSDVDVLVEFEPDRIPGLIRLSGMEIDLGKIIGRKVDLRTPAELSRYFREKVLLQADVRYEA